MTGTEFQSWLIAFAPYALIVAQWYFGRTNRTAVIQKVEAVQATADRVETNANGHLAVMTEMVSRIDPAVTRLEAVKLLDTAEAKAEGLVETARVTAEDLKK